MKKFITAALSMTALVISGCKDNTATTPQDAPTIEAVSGALSRTSLQPLATGVLAQDRSAVVGTFTYLTLAGIMGRDVYRIDTSEPRYVQETLGANPDPGSFAGGGGFAGFYTAIRAANSLLLALPSAPTTEVTAAEKAAMAGFLRTIKGLEYMRLIELRDTVGIPIQTDDPAEVTPVRCKEAVLAYIAALLDSANDNFTTAGATTKLPFVLPSGFTSHGRDYSVVSNLVRFNRGLKGKVNVLRAINRKAPNTAAANSAITELTAALGGAAAGAVSPTTFQFGPYYHFVAAGSEATANPRADAKIGLNPLVRDSVQAGDARAAKITTRSNLSGQGIATTATCVLCVATTANQEAPLGILRDEELVLLRAQAYIEVGNFASATADLNSVRTFYGLAPYAVFTTKAAAINALLYEKRYSLLFEGPQRWVDLREYGRLNSTYLRAEVAGDPYNKAFPLPRAELNARNLTDNPACTA
jgi:starch-binding outer membrane protein, SusD/RagB family